MFDNDRYVKITDINTKLTVQGRFEVVRQAIESLRMDGPLHALFDGWCCADCDGDGFSDYIAYCNAGQIWPVTPVFHEAEMVPKNTLRLRTGTLATVKGNYLPGSGWPDQQKFARRVHTRALRRFGKAIIAEQMMELE